MHHRTRLVASSLTALAFLALPGTVRAQETYYPPPPPTALPPATAQAPNGQYVTPLQQQTQQVYVPQSVALSGPQRITDWDDSQPIPPGYRVTPPRRAPVVVGGAVLFGSMYLISVLVGAAASDISSATGSSNPDGSLYIPAIGPFLQMGNTGSSTANVFLAIDGLAQCGGIAMFIYGIASPRTYLTRNDAEQRRPAEADDPSYAGRSRRLRSRTDRGLLERKRH